MKVITRAVWLISLVSLFTDIASEMLYPIMPLYLGSIGFSVALIGVLEGIAEATAGLSKGYFGTRSDASGKRLPFIRAGYGLSAISKPMMAMVTAVPWVFAARTMDRLGKGLRTGARDALLSDATTPEHKGRVFGFHRSMDTTGAFIGPILAMWYMSVHPGAYTTLFYYAVIPGIIAVALTMVLREKRRAPRITKNRTSLAASFAYVKTSPQAYRHLLFGLLAFALFNSSDMFLLLMVKRSGANDATVVGLYVFYNFVYAVLGYPMGVLGDRIGLKRTFLLGALIFAAVYAAMAFVDGLMAFAIVFFFYGVYAATNEGIIKAWISNIAANEETATAIGTYAGFNSIFALLASALAGAVWVLYGPAATFIVSALGVTGVVLYFVITRLRAPRTA